jgi:inosine-uridine nucleoside N-ribohydrolase
MRKAVILDCDNTAGIDGYEIDDALALLYLIGRPDVEILGVCATFGNGTIVEVTNQTRWFCRRIGHRDLPILRGAEGAGDWDTPASRFIARKADERPGQVHVVAAGPLGNVAGAITLDSAFPDNVAGIYAMGGYLEPVIFPKRPVGELNLSCDPHAAEMVLASSAPVHLMSAQICLQVPFLRKEFRALEGLPGWFREMVGQWYLDFSLAVGANGFYLWDLVPALALLFPEVVPRKLVELRSTASDLADGSILAAEVSPTTEVRDTRAVNLPAKITEYRMAMDEIHRGWKSGFAEARMD